jgi:hypothetical protein
VTDPTPQQQPERWHIKREIQIGHLITTLTIAAAVLIYAQKIEQRVALLEEKSQTQSARDARQDEHSRDTAVLLRDQLTRLEGKIDRLIEARR